MLSAGAQAPNPHGMGIHWTSNGRGAVGLALVERLRALDQHALKSADDQPVQDRSIVRR